MTMDKEKVIELIGNVEKYLLTYEESGKVSDFSMALQQLHEAEDELSKPDWISVEDELPPYGEQVFVISKKGYKYVSCRRFINKKNFNSNLIDKNDFILSFDQFSDKITHWCKIDKLEV